MKIGDYIRGKNTRHIFKIVAIKNDTEDYYTGEVVAVSQSSPFAALAIGSQTYLDPKFAEYISDQEAGAAILSGRTE